MWVVVADLIEPILSAGKTVKEKENYLMVNILNFCYLLIYSTAPVVFHRPTQAGGA